MRRAAGGRNAELIGERHVEREILGALIVEQIETDLPREILEPRIDLVYEHSARALSNALDYHSVFLMPVWRAIGKSTVLVKGRNLPKTLTVGGLILAALLALFLIRTDFDLKADRHAAAGHATRRLLRQQRHDQGSAGAAAISWSSRAMPCSGSRITIWNRSGREIIGQISETTERLDSLRQAKKNSRSLTEAQVAQIAGEYLQLLERAKSLQEQLTLIEQKRKNLIVRSPIAGQVLLPWDAEQSLMHRPVVTGQRVMTIADPSRRLGTRTGHAGTPHGARQSGGRTSSVPICR